MLDTVKYKLFARKRKGRKFRLSPSIILRQNFVSESLKYNWLGALIRAVRKEETSGRKKERNTERSVSRHLGPPWRWLGRLRRGGASWRCITKPLTALFMPPRKTCRVPEHTARMSLLSPHSVEKQATVRLNVLSLSLSSFENFNNFLPPSFQSRLICIRRNFYWEYLNKALIKRHATISEDKVRMDPVWNIACVQRYAQRGSLCRQIFLFITHARVWLICHRTEPI